MNHEILWSHARSDLQRGFELVLLHPQDLLYKVFTCLIPYRWVVRKVVRMRGMEWM